MFRKTTLVLGLFAAIAATPAFADPSPCKDGYVEKKVGGIDFCIREQDAKAFQAWADRCEQQAAIRRDRGLADAKAVFSKDSKGSPNCHVDGGHIAESGAL